MDGVQHSAPASTVTAVYASGIMSIGATDTSRTTLGFAVTPSGGGAGTYTFGALSPANALLQVGNPAQAWNGGVGKGSGSVTVTTFTATGATGTFAFTLVAVPGSGATGTKAVTEGVFNVTFR